MPVSSAVTITKASFHGWEALVLRNRVAEVTVVPAIGRIMQIALLEEAGPHGPFWSHPEIGPDLGGDENGWINLGGDKAWPAPQSRWEAIVDVSPTLAQLAGVGRCKPDVLQKDRAGVGTNQADHEAQQRRFAAAAWSDEHGGLAARQR